MLEVHIQGTFLVVALILSDILLSGCMYMDILKLGLVYP